MKLLFTFFLLSFSYAVHAQSSDSTKSTRIKHLSKELSISDSKSSNVAIILDDYKAEVNKLLTSNTLSGLELKAKIEELQGIKNKKLSAILTEEQLVKIIPTTEREKK